MPMVCGGAESAITPWGGRFRQCQGPLCRNDDPATAKPPRFDSGAQWLRDRRRGRRGSAKPRGSPSRGPTILAERRRLRQLDLRWPITSLRSPAWRRAAPKAIAAGPEANARLWEAGTEWITFGNAPRHSTQANDSNEPPAIQGRPSGSTPDHSSEFTNDDRPSAGAARGRH